MALTMAYLVQTMAYLVVGSSYEAYYLKQILVLWTDKAQRRNYLKTFR